MIVWSLGNEGGYGECFEAAYDWVRSMDGTRPIQYERAGYEGKTDIYCPMYMDYRGVQRYCEDMGLRRPVHPMDREGREDDLRIRWRLQPFRRQRPELL